MFLNNQNALKKVSAHFPTNYKYTQYKHYARHTSVYGLY